MSSETSCRAYHFDETSAFPSFKVMVLTFATIILTIVLEILIHVRFKGQGNAAHSSPHTRATRLAIACILYPIILPLFIIRINDATHIPDIGKQCQQYIPPTNWPAISVLNILPFTCASLTFLSALVDCVLVRWNTGLPANFENFKAEKTWPWVLSMPLLGVVGVSTAIFEGLKVPIALVMGDKEISAWTAGSRRYGDEVELRGNEGLRLVEDSDEECEEDEEEEEEDDEEAELEDENDKDGPPAYEEAVPPTSSAIGKVGGDQMV